MGRLRIGPGLTRQRRIDYALRMTTISETLMRPDRRFWAGRRVCVTGGTGFLGWQIVKRLLPIAAGVRILGLRPKSQELQTQLAPLDCVFGDVRDAAAVRQALHGCDVVIPTAGRVAVWGPALRAMMDIHVTGTQQIVRALPSGARLVTRRVSLPSAPRTGRSRSRKRRRSPCGG